MIYNIIMNFRIYDIKHKKLEKFKMLSKNGRNIKKYLVMSFIPLTLQLEQ